MAARGQYARGVARRAQILETALAVVARDGYSRATVKQIADEAGISQNGLLHHFGSKEALLSEVLQRRDEADHAAKASGPGEDGRGDPPPLTSMDDMAAGVARLLRHNASVPGLVQLYSRLSTEATDPGHTSHDYFVQRFRTIRGHMQVAFDELGAAGELPPGADPATLATVMVALLDGLQVQWLYDDEMDMAAPVEHLLALLAGGAPASGG
ncbi:TetR/AcrR family transcriptional regulator [uncultured Pseudokineococcus sp.]|uniref:TetR/AcrR family transcriptional regulator n=1 Tax=uncultured Pseudokineococcus sp. TaxID=1642928 RepID=UPI002603A57B|nr:TetR/AcrR family transcriptional regulator [uncultured Pseudokineococcus sp.]